MNEHTQKLYYKDAKEDIGDDIKQIETGVREITLALEFINKNLSFLETDLQKLKEFIKKDNE